MRPLFLQRGDLYQDAYEKRRARAAAGSLRERPGLGLWLVEKRSSRPRDWVAVARELPRALGEAEDQRGQRLARVVHRLLYAPADALQGAWEQEEGGG